MARQEDACWRCGTQWAPEKEPRTTLRLVHGDSPAATVDAERWINEGGSVAATAAR
jgi:hypothetical protein